MTRGLGAVQRQVLTALQQRGAHDSYRPNGTAELVADSRPIIRARWRWYTIDLLGLVDGAATTTERASAHRAVKTLACRGRLRTRSAAYPYDAPFAGYSTDHGDVVGDIDLAELHQLDSRWPARHGRRLWFRLPPPSQHRIPPDDQLAVLGRLDAHRPDEFEDFAAALDRHRAWRSPVGHLVAWLLCGHPATSKGESLTISTDTGVQHLGSP